MFKRAIATGLAVSLTATAGGLQEASNVIPNDIPRNISSHIPGNDVKIAVVNPQTGDPVRTGGGHGSSGASVGAIPVLAWIGGMAIRMSAHALKQASARGISQQVIKNTIENGKRTSGNNNTWIYTSGSGKDKIRVIVGKDTGKVVTTTKG